jgi:rhodanese-related sulfurtransferase
MDRILEFTGNHTLLVFSLMVSFFLLIFAELRRKASGLVNVEPGDAVALINNDGAVLDLRNTESFARGHIVNATNIPFDQLDASSNRLARLRDKPVVAVCDSGVTSNKAVALLRKAGFEKAYGLPVVTGKKTRSRKKG